MTVDRLRSLTLGDLLELPEADGESAVDEALQAALSRTGSFLTAHGTPVEEDPSVVFEPYDSGVAYDPSRGTSGVLTGGGPRGASRGGESALVRQAGLTQRSLLTVLSKGLLHAYDAQLAETARDRSAVRSARADGIRVYSVVGLPVPSVAYAFTTLWDVYLEADITDRPLRERVIDDWAEWYAGHGVSHVDSYRAVAATVSERIAAATGTSRAQLCYGFEIQEPLIRDGETTVVERY